MAIDQTPPGSATSPQARLAAARWRRWRWLGLPLAVYLGTRLVQFALVAWMLPPDGSTVADRLLSWDSGWFVRVARDGYPHGVAADPGRDDTSGGLAFFPGYPLLVRGLHQVTRLDFGDAALVVSWIAAAAAAVGLFALARRLYDSRVAAILTVLFCAQPMSVVLSMGYSEGLFVAFVAGALLAAHRRSWLAAGLCGLAAALTRPTGAAVAVALAVVAFVAVRERRPDRWRAVAAAVPALLGVPAYLGWVGWRTGDWHAWFDIQTAGWGTTFDFGLGAGTFVLNALRSGDGWVQVSVALLLIAAVVAAGVAVARRVWPPLLVYGLVALVLAIGQSGYYHSKPRLLVPVLVILVPGALALARARPRTAVSVLAGYSLFGLWYGAYLITVWRFAI
ncbi:mannosyltransferase family protein [Planosporangium sp. 12N6]|uniref:mannosyltransferase family protein n=1 Tax=Planosporangium spinosum TaxID=3402278 RepID=UPI003CE79C2D